MTSWTNTLGRVLSRVRVVGEHCCWRLRGRVASSTGYLYVSVHGVKHLAHRYVYVNLVGPIPSGEVLDHLCRHRWYVNPNHVAPVPGVVNTLRGVSVTAVNASKTRCKFGHPLAGANLYERPGRRGRGCRTCRRHAVRRYGERLRAFA